MGWRAADEFVPAVPCGWRPVPDEDGGAEPSDGSGFKDESGGRDLAACFNFHVASLAREVGHWRSNLEDCS